MGRRIAFVMNAQSDGSLAYGRNDAEEMFQLLVDPRFGDCDPKHSICLVDCSDVGAFFDHFTGKLLAHWQPTDQLVFYFSGHGLSKNGVFSLQLGGGPTHVLPYTGLTDLLASHRVCKAIITLDCCHSGEATGEKGEGNVAETIDRSMSAIPQGTAVMASCAKYQRSHEYPEKELSLFTWMLTEAVTTGLSNTPTQDGWIACDELVDHVRGRLESEEFSTFVQHPRHYCHDAAGRIPFAKNVSGRMCEEPALIERGDGGPAHVRWQRRMPALPPRAEAVAILTELLGSIRKNAVRELQKEFPEVDSLDENVRANIFLAEYRETQSDRCYELFMHPHLYEGKYAEREIKLRFRPGQGATGVAFRDGETLVTIRSCGSDSTPSSDWDARFELTERHRDCIHEQLQWILSIPLKDLKSGTPLAVLNIDGLVTRLDADGLERVVAVLAGEVLALSALLSDQPQVLLTVGWST